ncbi:MAG: ABC transporter transmembrane domain-containing protein [Proteobacteria bacterium]|nr:ABC transporter transmembrane domain-containing protein [Pseudomonadota bacterium]
MGQIRRLWPFLAPYRGRVLGAVLALIAAAGTVLAFGMGLRWLVDAGFAGGETALLDRALIGMLAIVAILALASWFRSYLVAWLGERLAADIRKAVYDNVIGLSPGFFEVTRTGEVLSRLTTDTSLLQTVIATSVSMALRNVILLFGGAVMMAVTSPKLTALAFLVVPLVVVPILVFGRRVRRLSRDSQDRIAEVGGQIDESINAVRTVQAFGHEELDRATMAERVEAAFDIAVRRTVARSNLAATVILLIFGAVGTILWIGGYDMMAGRISAGELSAFVFYAVVVAGSVGSLSEFFADIQRAAGAAERLLELLSTKPEISAPATPRVLALPSEGRVAFEGVTFRYPSRPDRAALEDLSFEVGAGERVALVGPSGAGKTTLFQLLLRFYDPEAGIVRFDGADLRELDPTALRARIGLVSQEPVIFSANAMENIRYGRPEASDAEVRAAAEAAAATEFLDRLPEGFETFLGEKGLRLSGGQRQRIAIARAILRDPALLLLDEATSALDAESERLVQDAIARLSEGRTSIVIAHRLATVQQADRILVLDQGRIVATGRHDELIAEGGLYARLAALQFDRADPVADGTEAELVTL